MPTTVNSVNFSFSLVCGSTAAIAIAADAPQMATAPPDRTPSVAGRPSHFDKPQPNSIVVTSAQITVTIGAMPNDTICANVTFAPNRPTPVRSTVLVQNSIPGRQVASCDRKWNAKPKNSAYNNCGPP